MDDELADLNEIGLRATGAQITVENRRVIVRYSYDQTDRPYDCAQALKQVRLRAYEGIDVYHGLLKIASLAAK